MNKIKSTHQYHLPKKQERIFQEPITRMIRLKETEWLLTFEKDGKGKAIVVNDKLETIRTQTYQLSTQKYVDTNVCVSKDYWSISSADNITILNNEGQKVFTITNKEWNNFNGSQNYFSEDGKYFINILPYEGGQKDLVQLRTTKDFSVLQEAYIPCYHSFYIFTKIPSSNTIILEAASGQDDCINYLLTLKEDSFEIVEWEETLDRIVGDIAPNNEFLVTAPHYGDEIITYALVDKQAKQIVKESQVFEEETDENKDPDSFDFWVAYVTNDWVLLLSRFKRLILFDLVKNEVKGEILPESYEIFGYDRGGKKTSNPSEILDYEGDILDYFWLKKGALLINHGGKKLVLYTFKI